MLWYQGDDVVNNGALLPRSYLFISHATIPSIKIQWFRQVVGTQPFAEPLSCVC